MDAHHLSELILDTGIILALVVQSAMLLWVIWKGRATVPYPIVFVTFAAFVIIVGVEHVIAATHLYFFPFHFILTIKAVAALSGIATVIWLPIVFPSLLTSAGNLSPILIEQNRIAENRFRSLIEATAYVVWTADPFGVITDEGGKQWRALTGMTSDIPNEEWESCCVHPEDKHITDEAWEKAAKNHAKYTIVYRIRTKESGYRWYQRTAVPVIDNESGQLEEWVGVCIDVTERRIAEQRLREAASKADAANKSKTEFLAVMSHELRTPLTAVIGFGELLYDEVLGPVNTDQRNAINRIQMSGTHLIGMIDTLLDFSGIEAGNVTVKPEVVNVNKLVTQVFEMMRPLSLQKNLQFDITCPKRLVMSTDPQKLRQILINLVGNSIKFTPQGRISIVVQEKNEKIAFRVSDTGIGIPPEAQDRVFEKFWQVRQGLTRNVGGAGLGLAIVKKFVELLGGDVYLNSIEQLAGDTRPSGSTFTVILASNMPTEGVSSGTN
jgi:PAS domain S-box-containing protein